MATENLADIEGRATEMASLEDKLHKRDAEITKKETDIAVRERQLNVRNEAIKTKAHEITLKTEKLKVDEARLEAIRKEIEKGGPAPAEGVGMDTAIILQQKQLLEKCMSQNEKTDKLLARQLKLEEDRAERREGER